MKLSNLTTSDYISILMKGPWGFGKTIAAASFAVDGPVYLAYWDKKAPIELVQFLKKIGRDNLLNQIEYDVYDARNANEFLNKMRAIAENCQYYAVINDSVTRMTSGAVNWSLGFREKKRNEVKIIPEFDDYKAETSLVAQSLDVMTNLQAHVIWTCHPLPSLKTEGSGATMRVSKVNNIVTYGSKVAGIIPGSFSEIYHFSKLSNWNASGGHSMKYLVSTEAVGDDYAKSNIGLSTEMDITDKLFYEVWREAIKELEVKIKDKKTDAPAKPVVLSGPTSWK